MASYNTIEKKLHELLPELDESTVLHIALTLDAEFKEFYKDLDFLKGGKAFFDYLLCAVANHWHGRPEIDSECQKENEIVMRFAEDALQSFDQDAHTTWLEIGKLQTEIADLRRQVKELQAK